VNDRHSDDAMINDALAREIEDALAVEPSPQFVARVLASKPERRTWRFSWTFAVAVSSAAAAIVAAVLMMPERGARTPAPTAQLVIATLPPVSAAPSVAPAARPEEPPVASAPVRARVAPIAAVPIARRAETKEPEVLFAKDESAALQRLMRGITRGAVDPATLFEPTTAIAAIQPEQIVVAPLADLSSITIEPFGSLAEGVRQ
jgi:hypothetical protein